MKLYTRKGDDGKTNIIGSSRLTKDHKRISSYGVVDELNAILGITRGLVDSNIQREILHIQNLLFEIGAELASEVPRNKLLISDVKYLEDLIDSATKNTPELKSFILPGGTNSASWLHFARTVTRRAEREIVALDQDEELNQFIIPWINRLSDLFFAWSRLENFSKSIGEHIWEARN